MSLLYVFVRLIIILAGFEPSAVIRRDLEDLFGTFDGQNAVQWKKAIFIAKLGSRGISRSSGELQTAEERELALTAAEDKALQAEREKLSSQKGILPVVLAVALAAFLQGHVQSSINGASIFADVLDVDGGPENKHELETGWRDWQIGGMNASPFLTAAFLGAPAALPTNYYIGRRGSLIVSAVLIIASSLASAFSRNWVDLLGYRIIGGIGMGIKAVSGPVLAAESVTGFWRGSIMITWQLWVACGIMLGLVANIVIAAIADSLDIETTDIVNNPRIHKRAMQFILGAPLVPSVALLVAVYFCYESPRFYMRPEDPSNFNPQEALRILKAIRPTEVSLHHTYEST
jgi:MFS family permease